MKERTPAQEKELEEVNKKLGAGGEGGAGPTHAFSRAMAGAGRAPAKMHGVQQQRARNAGR